MKARRPSLIDTGADRPIIVRLRRLLDLTATELADLGQLGTPVRTATTRQDLLAPGEDHGVAVVLHSGWAIRHRTLRDGRRQIIEFVLPGDLCDASSFVAPPSDSAITAIEPVSFGLVDAATMLELVTRSPRIGALLWWLEAQEQFFVRAHLVAIGRLKAYERVAYLIWELWARLRNAGLALDHMFEFPATQDLIADATGLSHVHVSRTLSKLEQAGIIKRAGHRYRIIDAAKLCEIAQVDVSLLQNRLPERLRAVLGVS